MILGASPQAHGVNFALFVEEASALSLCLFALSEEKTARLVAEVPLDPQKNRTGNIWHIFVHELPHALLYAYRIGGFHTPFILDPYAKAIVARLEWGAVHPLLEGSQKFYAPLGAILSDEFAWENDAPPTIPLEDLIIYELHVRGFTQHSSSHVAHPGTFLGIVEKIPYLLDLGINAVELLPVQEWDELEYARCYSKNAATLYNYWGYSPVNFFSLMSRYATAAEPNKVAAEFKTLVKELHRHGIELILDVVYNHTAEQGEGGLTYSYRHLGDSIYYIKNSRNEYLNFSGCGNSFNANHPVCQDLIIASLRYWVTEMHVDGFRFDLAALLTRGVTGTPLSHPPLIERINEDPILANCKLIAEPWDAAGLYQVGNFAAHTQRWSEWNGRYRDCLRRFLKGDEGVKGEFAMRLSGSQDLYSTRTPAHSIHFLTSHDGFSLADLVSYNIKHNLPNGENNRDGLNQNDSWNCGEEGVTTKAEIVALRERQMRNFHFALMISQGTPMLTMGDEYAHTKQGNNNTWCQDNELSWFLWDKREQVPGFWRFCQLMNRFRKQHKQFFCRAEFLFDKDIIWHGLSPNAPKWDREDRFIAFTLKDPTGKQNPLYIAFNASDKELEITLPPPPISKEWYELVNTGKLSPEDIVEEEKALPVRKEKVRLVAHSALLLKAR